jgi:hypothetical protein
MRSITVTILTALIAQAPAKDLLANIDPEEFADKFIDKMIDRLSGTSLDDADLDRTTLAKPHAGTTHGSAINLYQPLLSQGVARFPAASLGPKMKAQQSMQYMQPAMPRRPMPALRASTPQQEVSDISEMMKERGINKAMVSAMGVAGALAPTAAQASVTPSLQSLINSVIAGGIVLAVIAGAVSTVSNFGNTEG